MSPTDGLTSESALVVLVPEAEPLVGPFRERYDPSASAGMPAHITINYPFLPMEPNWYVALERLDEVLGAFSGFEFSFSEIRRFPDVLYLAPDPQRPFKDMISAVASAFPESPPYAGAIPEITPHLTVAQVEDAGALNKIAASFARAAEDQMPITGRAESVWLMDNRGGLWKREFEFELS
jgi:2'-5' RNA ligase